MTTPAIVLVHRRITQARRRLIGSLFIERVIAGWIAALILVLVWGLIEPFLLRPRPNPWLVPSISLSTATLWALVQTYRLRPTPLAAALALDQRFGLHERVTSALTLAPNEIESPIGRAVLQDAAAVVEPLAVGSRFPIEPHRAAWFLPLLLAGVVGLALFYDPPLPNFRVADSPQASPRLAAGPRPRPTPKTDRPPEQLPEEKPEEPLDTEALRTLQKEVDAVLREPPPGQDAANLRDRLAKLTSVEENLARQEELQAERVQQLIDQLRELGKLDESKSFEDKESLGNELREALRENDLERAASAVEEIRRKLEKDELTPRERADLQRRLDEIARALEPTPPPKSDAVPPTNPPSMPETSPPPKSEPIPPKRDDPRKNEPTTPGQENSQTPKNDDRPQKPADAGKQPDPMKTEDAESKNKSAEVDPSKKGAENSANGMKTAPPAKTASPMPKDGATEAPEQPGKSSEPPTIEPKPNDQGTPMSRQDGATKSNEPSSEKVEPKPRQDAKTIEPKPGAKEDDGKSEFLSSEPKAARKQELDSSEPKAARKQELDRTRPDSQRSDEMARLAEQFRQMQESLQKDQPKDAAEQMQELAKELMRLAARQQQVDRLREQRERVEEERRKIGDALAALEPNPPQARVNAGTQASGQPGAGRRPTGPPDTFGSKNLTQQGKETPTVRRTYLGAAPGKGFKAATTEELATEIRRAAQEGSEGLELSRQPRSSQESVRDYFERLQQQTLSRPPK